MISDKLVKITLLDGLTVFYLQNGSPIIVTDSLKHLPETSNKANLTAKGYLVINCPNNSESITVNANQFVQYDTKLSDYVDFIQFKPKLRLKARHHSTC